MGSPRSIRVLDAQVANKIAAGEVIERPASVVKELIENSIDAGATDIRVEVRGGGLQQIRVVDNGWGMTPEEAEICFLRHATSKIETADDLTRIETLGFRGEALPSIAAVAAMTITTRRAGRALGAFVTVDNGNIVDRGSRGCPDGTSVSVQNLFKNFPARLKYMKSAGTEFSHISNLVSQFALAYPELRFALVNDGRTAFQSVGDGSLFSALIKVYGVTIAEGMVEIQPDDLVSTARVSGFVGGPGVSRSNRNCLSFFVNRRWIQSRTLSFAVEDACGPILSEGRHPIAAINIEVPPDEVDVNVHPAKSEVRFLRDREIFVAVQNAVRRALFESVSMPALVSRPDSPLPTIEDRVEVVGQRHIPVHLPLSESTSRATEGTVSDIQTTTKVESQLWRLRVIGQMLNTFIIAEGPYGMYLVDQHRAHERVLFDRLNRERSDSQASSQLLLEPVVVELVSSQVEVLESRHDEISRLGFVIEPFGDTSCLIRAVPAVLGFSNAKESAREIVEKTVSDGRADDWQEQLLKTVACKGAIKAGQALTDVEMRELLLQLETTTLPSICPHGAPIMVHLSQAQLERQFGR